MSYCVYDGPSQITGERIIALLSGIENRSANRKTGDIVQLWVLKADKTPINVLKEKEDGAICGDCPLRGRACYVNIAQAPQALWRQWSTQAKSVKHALPSREKTRTKTLRLTAYGDPAALPLSFLKTLISQFRNVLGYTHLWRTNPGLQPFVMASVETVEQAKEAQDLGWRTFRIRGAATDPRLSNEALCPYEATGLQCTYCNACNGTNGPFKAHIVTTVHGVAFKQRAFQQLHSPSPTANILPPHPSTRNLNGQHEPVKNLYAESY